jgi:hypothetical protein
MKEKKIKKKIRIFTYIYMYVCCVATCVHMPQVHNYKKQKYLFITIMVITVSTNNCWALLYFLNCTHFTEVKYTPHVYSTWCVPSLGTYQVYVDPTRSYALEYLKDTIKTKCLSLNCNVVSSIVF